MSAAGGGKSGQPGDPGDPLWDAIKKTVKPLRKPAIRPASANTPKTEKSPPPPLRKKPAAQPFSPPPAARAHRPPPLTPLDRRARAGNLLRQKSGRRIFRADPGLDPRQARHRRRHAPEL
jgi:hypothetical protein